MWIAFMKNHKTHKIMLKMQKTVSQFILGFFFASVWERTLVTQLNKTF